jgi:hypothetical protein
LKIPLWQLVRASTAAPIYFPPEVLQWDAADPSSAFVFVDGGVTPYNNPAFLLFRMATHPAYRLNWKTGERNLLLVSVGTGAAPHTDLGLDSPNKNLVANLASLPGALMYGVSVDQDICCRTVGRCTYGAPIDLELGDMVPVTTAQQPVPVSTDLGRAFLYARYNADLSPAGLHAMGLGDIRSEDVSQLDSVAHVDALRRVGRKVAETVRLEHLGPFL